MNSDFDLELGTHQRQIDSLPRYVDTLIERIQKVDNLEHPDWKSESADSTNKKNNSNTLSDAERTIIDYNTMHNQDEAILEIAKDLIRFLCDSVNVFATTELKSRGWEKPGLVTISFSSVEEKIDVLWKRHHLLDIPAYTFVFLESSKPHTERLIKEWL